ncbi:MAG: MFS transporter [Actinobacteria bacterium]|nr:MAG: MFS transporter [Actinomycetota bacterium]
MSLRITDANRPWWTLFGACTGLFVLMLDSTIVTLALPAIRTDLDASASGLQWVMNAYLLVIAAFVVTAGRLGDMFGRRLMFTIGLAIFAGGSVLSGAAWSQDAIIGGRLVQGLGAAMLLPLSLAIVCDAFSTEQQPRALGIWASISAIALGVGPLIGGVLVDLDWRLIFWINVPILALGVAVMLVAVRETRDETSTHELDYAGLVLIASSLTALVLPLAEAANWALDSTQSVVLFAAAAVFIVAFWVVEHRVRQPIVDFELFRNGPYFGATAAAFGLVGTYWSLMFLEPQYLQGTLGYSATTAGILILPITVPMIVISPLAGRLIARLGARVLMTMGMVCGLAGLVILAQISKTSGYALVLPGYLLFGIALGFVYAPMSTAAMAAMPRQKSGIASGVLAMNRVLAGAVALAVTGAVFQDLLPSHGFAIALARSNWVLVGLLAISTVLTWLFVRSAPSLPSDARLPASADAETLRHHQHHCRFHL